MKKPCHLCEKEFHFKHSNQKFCLICLRETQRCGSKPKADREEVAKIRNLSQNYRVNDIAKMLHCSRTRVIRIKHYYGIKESWQNYPEDLIRRVSEYYSKHGKQKTIERFPDVRVKSLERYFRKYGKPRQIRWKPEQHRLLAQMAGIISPSRQARVFARPRAYGGSIRVYWLKNRKHRATFINGAPLHLVKNFLPPKYWTEEIAFRRQPQVNENQSNAWRIILWTDLEKYCNPTTPTHLRKAFRTMAKFQRWLHGTDNVKLKIKKMMKCSTPEQLSKLLMVS